ncbi:DUF1080 domain-containing protein [Marinilongibacter aquaticus]|uniref:family 16 glycoside hydrolase n=1 Tax=Marinilongibacter aquaticus TaxID=2975157 RepID=UPI0021BDBD9A|nr:family 16 glycoside hydrolase [Marinilongibacter aquaticus]UBM57872.1 DUF1080 domain-containing protein [Marinilongibacter aquaticus]
MKKIRLGYLLACLPLSLFAQKKLPLQNLDDFKNPAGNWKIVGKVFADPTLENDLQTEPGTGVLANIHAHGTYGQKYELISKFEHGDADVEFDFMMAKGSNSGFYLQGNYEIQLLDSWGKAHPKYNDCGGIYERWDDAKPEGQKGYEGTAPRINACKAPGLWQHMKISFQAARFNSKGEKIANAKILSISMNGMLLHENVELSGVTRGALTQKEVAQGPIRIQGDHGSVAFKNLVITNFDQKPASLSNLKYSVNYDAYDPNVDPKTLKVDDSGSLNALTWEFLKQPNEYNYTITGDLNIPVDGKYNISLYSTSNNSLTIDGKEVLADKYTGGNDERKGEIELKKGTHKLVFHNAKYDGWMKPTLGLFIAGPGFRPTALHNFSSMLGSKPADPILYEAENNTNLRSFMDIWEEGEKHRVVHNINVGFKDQIHYSYDLDKGALFQVWRGGFLNATPMWNSRGDGSSRPLGALTALEDEMTISSSTENWPKDSVGTGYVPKGYSLDHDNVPTMHYLIYGTKVDDKTEVIDGKYFQREITVGSNDKKLFAKLAEGKSIEKVKDGLYAVDNSDYFIKVAPETQVVLKSEGQNQELIVPIQSGKLTYQLLF